MKVAVALSGGVDSSAALLLLRQEGYEVAAFTLRLFDGAKAEIAVTDAAGVCKELGIAHHILDCRNEFKALVIDDFLREYSAGRTPNPCVRCNERIKFGLLRKAANQLGYSKLATGHYARVVFENGEWKLLKGLDAAKDQSYALYRLEPDELKNTLFPLGKLYKDEIRRMVLHSGLPVRMGSESQDICFVPETYREFLLMNGIEDSPGDFVSLDGAVLGCHRGIHRYTVGQRRNLGLPGGNGPFYVVRLDIEKNQVILGGKRDILSAVFSVREPHWLILPEKRPEIEYYVKVRYRSPMKPGRVVVGAEGVLDIILDEPQEAVTPGQSAVFYDGVRVVGGGIISVVQSYL